MRLITFTASLLLLFNLKAQAQFRPPTPQAASIAPVLVGREAVSSPRQMTPIGGNQGFEHYRQDELEYQRRIQRNEILQQEIDEFLEQSNAPQPLQYTFPEFALPHRPRFEKAYAALDSMLRGHKPVSLREAVYIMENTYLDGKLDYSWFNGQLNYLADVCRQKMRKDGIKPSSREGVNMIIYRVMCEATDVQNPRTKIYYRSLPFTYDFIDYKGEKDYTKTFVSKLLRTHTGTCRSMPLLYLILAETLQTEAYMTFAPSHSFVRFPDNRGTWRNVELTNGRLGSDAWVLNSGYMKAEALASGIYMDTLSRRQHVAELLANLGHAYLKKGSWDSFALRCVNRTLEVYPNSIRTVMMRANYYTALLSYVGEQKGWPPRKEFEKDKQALAILENRDRHYAMIEESGHEDMPPAAYEAWLKSLDKAAAATKRKKR